jgi:hypothetical protein
VGKVRSEVEQRRIERNSPLVFSLAMFGAVIAIFVGFGIAIASCEDSVAEIVENFGKGQQPSVTSIPIAKSSCPYLRLVSVAAANAGAPWNEDIGYGEPPWSRFSSQLRAPLGALDIALGDAIPHVPALVAADFSEVRRDVEIGRLDLATSYSVDDYMARAPVVEGYLKLVHASELVGNACGFEVAPPPFTS